MTAKEYQKITPKTAVYGKSVKNIVDYAPKSKIEQTLRLAYAVAGLTSEAGETSGKFKKMLRGDAELQSPDAFKEAMKKELGGTLWYISQICNEMGLSMEDVMEDNAKDLAGRKSRGTIKGSGDVR